MAATTNSTSNATIHNATTDTPDTVARKIESPPSPKNAAVAPPNSKRRSLPPIVPPLAAVPPQASPVAPASAAGSATTPVAAPPPTPNPLPTPKAERLPTPEPAGPSQDIIDMETFQQILDLDDDDREFSRGMAWAYFSQVEQTFKEMDAALKAKDLAELHTLGHFLKGSSAALGVAKVQASCENIQHYGNLRDEEALKDLSPAEALSLISARLTQVKVEYNVAEKWLKKWYADHPDPVQEP